MAERRINFGVCVGPADVAGTDDATLYRLSLEDVAYAQALGYSGVWVLEHHFSDYYPTPNALLALAHYAGRYPGLELGTMVIVAPWHQPVRLAEDIAMLSLISDAPLHLGLGRGSAPSEYEAFGMGLDESRGRFKETLDIVQLALSGEPFTYRGDFYAVPREVVLRPRPRRELINLYGAVTTVETAKRMASYGVPPLSNAIRPPEVQRELVRAWEERPKRADHKDAALPIQAHLIVADTDAEADALARVHMPPFFQAQVTHYKADLETYSDVQTYDLARLHQTRIRLSDPANLDDFMSMQLIGSPDRVAERVQAYIDMGFDKFIVTTNTPGIPKALRHEWLRRFAREVAPAFKDRLAPSRAAA